MKLNKDLLKKEGVILNLQNENTNNQSIAVPLELITPQYLKLVDGKICK